MRKLICLATTGLLIAACNPASAGIITPGYSGGTAGAQGYGVFFDLTSPSAILVTHMNTTTTAGFGADFNITIYIRSGTALGGSVSDGPGSSMEGWTLLGGATGNRGFPPSPTSNQIDTPDFVVEPGSITGVAILFDDIAPIYTTRLDYTEHTDGFASIVVGDIRSNPFTGTGTFTEFGVFAGAIVYEEVPTPATLSLFSASGLATLRRRRR